MRLMTLMRLYFFFEMTFLMMGGLLLLEERKRQQKQLMILLPASSSSLSLMDGLALSNQVTTLLLLSLETWFALVVQLLQPTLSLASSLSLRPTMGDHASFDEPS